MHAHETETAHAHTVHLAIKAATYMKKRDLHLPAPAPTGPSAATKRAIKQNAGAGENYSRTNYAIQNKEDEPGAAPDLKIAPDRSAID